MWSIQLQAAGLNQWMDEMEQRITLAGDLAGLMETETESLKNIWEGEAEKIWKTEFLERINKIKIQLAEMNQVVAGIGKTGKNLADMEIKMIAEAKKL